MAQDNDTLNLRILSPSPEVEGGVTLRDLPQATTVRELRQRIQDAAPSRPATDRMRLIYRGRVVANDSDTLDHIFGTDAVSPKQSPSLPPTGADKNQIRESKDQSLHLVLRELPNSTTSAPALSPVPPQSPLQANPFRTLPEHRPIPQPTAPQPPHLHHPHHHGPPLNPLGPRPVPLAPHLQFAQAIMDPQPPHLPPHIQQQFAQAVRDYDALRGQQTATPPHQRASQDQQRPQRTPMGLPNLPAGQTRIVRQEGIGPNGERWAVTWNNTTNIAVNPNQQPPTLPTWLSRPAGNLPTDEQLQARLVALRSEGGPALDLSARSTPSPALGNVSDQMLQRIRSTMEHARQEMDNVRVLLQPSGGQAASVGALAAANPPAWRVDQIRLSVRNLITGLDNVDRGLTSLVADPVTAQNRDFVSLQESASDLRRQAEEFNRLLDRLPRSDSAGSALSIASGRIQQGTLSPSATVPTELFILSSPEGPVGILFEQRGTFSTAASSMPFQVFSEHFNTNRLQLGYVGRQIGLQNSMPRLPAHVLPQTGTQPTQRQQPAQPPLHAQGLVPAPNQNVNPAQPPPVAPAPQVNRVDNIAGHLWLVFKLAVFVYFFAGGGGWYRPLMICLIAGVVYLAQVGIFEEHFTAARQYVETLLPPGALGLADRTGNNPRPVDNRLARTEPQRAQTNRDPTPEEAARRLQQQHRDQRFGWVRESVRTTERAFAIFVASLWPGIGERMVQAQEERVRAERAAEEERQAEEFRRQEEEQRKEQEAREAKQSGASDHTREGQTEGAYNESNTEASGSKGKGKAARVEDAGPDVD